MRQSDNGHTDDSLFFLIAELHRTLGQVPLNQMKGCWEHQVDDYWKVSINGQPQPIKDSAGTEIAPFNAFVYFNGWPAGYFSPAEGTFAAGDAANEVAFAEALKAATVKARTP